jgi:hypothetical protein
MAHSCPACGEHISIWRAPNEFACPRCDAPLRVRNSGAMFLTIVVVPIVAEVLSRSLYPAAAGWGFGLALVLCLIIGAPMYYAFAKVDKA